VRGSTQIIEKKLKLEPSLRRSTNDPLNAKDAPPNLTSHPSYLRLCQEHKRPSVHSSIDFSKLDDIKNNCISYMDHEKVMNSTIVQTSESPQHGHHCSYGDTAHRKRPSEISEMAELQLVRTESMLSDFAVKLKSE